MAVTLFGIGCGVIALVVCVAYAVWYLAPQKGTESDVIDKPSANTADSLEQ